MKQLLAYPLGWLTFHANRRFTRQYDWYATKDKVLKAFGRRDGCDMQILPPLKCWTCNGTGKEVTNVRFLEHTAPEPVRELCSSCTGSGEYAPAKYVRLTRWRLGSFVFHKPDGSMHDRGLAESLWRPKDYIQGLVQHKGGYTELGYWCRVVLELLFNTRWILKVMRRHYPEKLRAWALRITLPMRRRFDLLTDDERLPF